MADQDTQDRVARIVSVDPSKRSHRGVAPKIRKLKLRHPELTDSEIARRVGCDPSNVSQVLKTFLGRKSEGELRQYQESQADVFDSVAYRMLSSLTENKINKMNGLQATTAAAILIDKARLVRGQATGINVSVLLDVVEAIRSKPASGTTIDGVLPSPNETSSDK